MMTAPVSETGPLNRSSNQKRPAKKSEYNVRIMEVEHGTFTPLIFTVKGVMGSECRTYHKILAGKIAEKTGERYD